MPPCWPEPLVVILVVTAVVLPPVAKHLLTHRFSSTSGLRVPAVAASFMTSCCL